MLPLDLGVLEGSPAKADRGLGGQGDHGGVLFRIQGDEPGRRGESEVSAGEEGLGGAEGRVGGSESDGGGGGDEALSSRIPAMMYK